MKTLSTLLLCLIWIGFTASGSIAQEGSELAGKMASGSTDGDSIAKLKMQIKSGSGSNASLNLQIKSRRNAGKSQVLYQVLFPLNRKGEAALLSQAGASTPGGYVLSPPNSAPRPLGKSNLLERALNSDLAYLDLIENFFLWENQNITGSETVGRIDCLQLESKPGSGDSSPYSLVKSWIDPKKLVAMRVEKYDSSGNMALRIDAKNITKDDEGRFVPSSLSARRTGSGTITEIDGSSIRHDVSYTDADFTASTMATLKFSR